MAICLSVELLESLDVVLAILADACESSVEFFEVKESLESRLEGLLNCRVFEEELGE